jgi:predicted nucleotide-binding protein (sugar kinase/HSP70/actin superfamily)
MYAYEKAKIEDMNKKEKLIRENIYKLKSKKIKLLVVGHPYNIYDEMIGKPLLKLFNDEVELIYSNLFDEKKANSASKKLSRNLYFKYNKENIGSIELCKKEIDGIIFITSFPCGPDSITNELVMRKIKIPYLNLVIDEIDSLTGFETRIESFIDMLKERRNYE